MTGSILNGMFFFMMITNFEMIRCNYRVAEHDQTITGVERIKEWSMHTGHLDEDDILISASVDEIISRETLHQLRWCEIKSDVTFGGLWMPMGNLNHVSE